jgi:hypothetical protein
MRIIYPEYEEGEEELTKIVREELIKNKQMSGITIHSFLVEGDLFQLHALIGAE